LKALLAACPVPYLMIDRFGSAAGFRSGRTKVSFNIRINDQWRICFVWKTDGAHRAEIVDYH